MAWGLIWPKGQLFWIIIILITVLNVIMITSFNEYTGPVEKIGVTVASVSWKFCLKYVPLYALRFTLYMPISLLQIFFASWIGFNCAVLQYFWFEWESSMSEIPCQNLATSAYLQMFPNLKRNVGTLTPQALWEICIGQPVKTHSEVKELWREAFITAATWFPYHQTGKKIFNFYH